MEKLLLHLGFTRSHQKGSHAFYRHPDGRTTTIPHHPGRVLAIPLIRKIMRDIEISVEEYNKAL
jgi:predicted RNA binding protein YcfA (HicA-like mRNA interferase family)